MSVRRFSLLMAWVTNTRFAHTIGEELPGPGNGTRQRTFSLVLHFTGKSFSTEMPVPSSPRQAGQFPPNAEKAIERAKKLVNRFAIEFFINYTCAKSWAKPQCFLDG